MMRIVFFGTPEFSLPPLHALYENPEVDVVAVVCQPDRPAGRGKRLRPPPTKIFALEKGIPVVQPSSVKREFNSFRETLLELGPCDGAVVVAFGQILPQQLLDHFGGKCLNIHASLLPKYRGAAPIQRAVMNGERETGVCIMQLEAGLDCGPVYVESRVPLEPGTTSGDLHILLSKQGALLLVEHLRDILEGRLQAQPQDHSLATHAAKISKDEAAIDWSQNSERVQNIINGLSPFPGAYAHLDNKRLKLLRARALSLEPGTTTPGKVVLRDGQLLVECGSGLVELMEVQLEGKRALSSNQFLNSGFLEDGSVLK